MNQTKKRVKWQRFTAVILLFGVTLSALTATGYDNQLFYDVQNANYSNTMGRPYFAGNEWGSFGINGRSGCIVGPIDVSQ